MYESKFIFFRLEVPKPSNKIYFSNIPLFICLSSFGVIFTLLYLLWPQPWFQHISYGVIILWSYWLEIKIVRQKKCKVCKRIFLLSLSLFLFAFFLWNIDKTFCSDLEWVPNLFTHLNPLFFSYFILLSNLIN